jgi:calcineurin-like phosphoesterase family protein
MKILHLSDVHYGFLTNKDDPLKPVEESSHFLYDKATRQPRPKDLVRIMTSLAAEKGNVPPDAIVVSGDLGWSGSKKDYEYALEFLEALRATWKDTIFVVNAGNHDVDLTVASNEQRQDAFIEMLRAFYAGDFPKIFPLLDGDKSADWRHRLIGFHQLNEEAFFVSVNSAASINQIGDPILLRPQVLPLVKNQLHVLAPPAGALRVFVLHHHLLPFADPPWGNTADTQEVREKPDTTYVANSARLQSWLAESAFHLVLHGHKHIFHGREDLLWRTDETWNASKVLILGAGSAGVNRREMGRIVPHSFNLITNQRFDDNYWEIRTETGFFSEDSLTAQKALSWHSRRSVLGAPRREGPFVFQARDMVLCHSAIASGLVADQQVTNFISIVEDSTYRHPPTANLGGGPATEEDVQRSFAALHPEYDSKDKWNDSAKIDNNLRNLSECYRIQHGPRLFSRVRLIDPKMKFRDLPENLRPIKQALANVSETTRAYVGLYNPERDVVSDWGPPPGLVGIQFVPRRVGKILDVVLTFRNLELSFWWVVNMLEARRLLEWACESNYRPGRVTFFSAIVEWRSDPRPMFISRIDKMEPDALFAMVMAANAGNQEAVDNLLQLLEEKRLRTTSLNIEFRSLESLVTLVKALHQQKKKNKSKAGGGKALLKEDFLKALEDAISALRKALDESSLRSGQVEIARDRLETAIDSLRSLGAKAS